MLFLVVVVVGNAVTTVSLVTLSVIAFVVAEGLFTADVVFNTTAVLILSDFVIDPVVCIVGMVWIVVVSAGGFRAECCALESLFSAVVVVVVLASRTSVTATIFPTGVVAIFAVVVVAVVVTVIFSMVVFDVSVVFVTGDDSDSDDGFAVAAFSSAVMTFMSYVALSVAFTMSALASPIAVVILVVGGAVTFCAVVLSKVGSTGVVFVNIIGSSSVVGKIPTVTLNGGSVAVSFIIVVFSVMLPVIAEAEAVVF